jgi:hypothetical protein
MSEWLKEHAWKANPATLTDAHRTLHRAIDSTTCRLEMLFDMTPCPSTFVAGFEPTLHSSYTIRVFT